MSRWYIEDRIPGAEIGYRAIVEADGTTVCNPSPMGEANARLIAQAPELLAMLIKADAWIAMYHDKPGHDAASRRMTDAIRAVIAKAGGAA